MCACLQDYIRSMRLLQNTSRCAACDLCFKLLSMFVKH